VKRTFVTFVAKYAFVPFVATVSVRES